MRDSKIAHSFFTWKQIGGRREWGGGRGKGRGGGGGGTLFYYSKVYLCGRISFTHLHSLQTLTSLLAMAWSSLSSTVPILSAPLHAVAFSLVRLSFHIRKLRAQLDVLVQQFVCAHAYCHSFSLVFRDSLVPRPHPLMRKRVWWLLSDFLVVLSQQSWFWTSQLNSAMSSKSARKPMK